MPLRCLFLPLLLINTGALPAVYAQAQVTGEQVKRAIRLGVQAVLERQNADGTWPERYYPGGETCLATLALLQAGEPLDSPAVSRALGAVRLIPHKHVYVVSLQILALTRADPKRYHDDIQAAAEWLVAAQDESGLWTYTEAGGRFDHSNSQFAILALGAAADAGIDVPRAVWQKAQQAVLRTQSKDGGWSYQEGASYGSMTAAGVADLLIFGNNVEVGREKTFRNGVAPGCGEYRLNKPLADGLKWLGRNFEASRNPGRGAEWVYYWLYAAERCGVLSGQRYFGKRDWYREGARYLVKAQAAGGTWGRDLASTCFAILFLSKGHRPLIVQKLQWSDDSAWNLDRYDVEHLVAFIGDKLGEPGAWQVVGFDSPLEDWLAAPLLYMHGHRFPKWSPEQREKVRKFIEQGGTLLVEACCGRGEFRRGFEEFAAQAFPEAPLGALGRDHAVYSAIHPVEPSGLMGIDVGCRTSVIFSPNDLSCLWEQAVVPDLSDAAFKIGTNVAAYAAGRQPLRDRLDVVTLPAELSTETGPPAGDALRLAQVVYDGDWRPDPRALVKFAEFMRDELRLDVVTRYRSVRLTDPELYQSPILFMTGHYGVQLAPAERAALAAHLRRGGFLFAEACCGRREFDESFRALMTDVLPDATAGRLPADHPIFKGKPGFSLPRVRYREPALAEQPGLDRPELWGWIIDGRLAVVCSPYGLACGLDGHVCYNCRGVDPADARRLAANIVLHALTH